jgi:hypothetical protein
LISLSAGKGGCDSSVGLYGDAFVKESERANGSSQKDFLDN